VSHAIMSVHSVSTRLVVVTVLAVLLPAVCALGAGELLSWPLVFPRGNAMGGTGMSYGGTEESVHRNPAWAGDFHRLCLTVPGLGLNIDNNFFSVLAYMAEHRQEFDSAQSDNTLFADSLMRKFDGKWFGMDAEIPDLSFFIRGLGVMFRSRFSANFSANRGLLFPFMLAEYGQERELSVVYGRKFANDYLQIGGGVKFLRQQKRIVSVASNNIGKIDNDFWVLSESDWQHGIGLDFGVIGNVPGRRHLAASVRNIALKTREQGVPEISFGYARDIRQLAHDEHSFVGDITAAAEYVNLLGTEPALSRLKLGGELNFNLLPRSWLTLRLRSGLDGGYLTFGIGARALRFVSIDYVTYAKEIGSYVGQEVRRRHLLYGKVQLNFNHIEKKPSAEVLEDEAPVQKQAPVPADSLPPAGERQPPPPPPAAAPPSEKAAPEQLPEPSLPPQEPVPEALPDTPAPLEGTTCSIGIYFKVLFV